MGNGVYYAMTLEFQPNGFSQDMGEEISALVDIFNGRIFQEETGLVKVAFSKDGHRESMAGYLRKADYPVTIKTHLAKVSGVYHSSQN